MLLNARRILAARWATNGYEDRFSHSLLEAVRPGDCVWDIGANVGFYTTQLSDRVGPDGIVYAFEPAPACFERLANLGRANIRVLNFALGDVQGQMPLSLGQGPLANTHTLVDNAGESSNAIKVRVARGDDVVRELEARVPNVIKVDVEGFEREVIAGLASTLTSPECRAIFCEVHFGILERRGAKQAPAQIANYLKRLGYNTRWIDLSHLSAVRF